MNLKRFKNWSFCDMIFGIGVDIIRIPRLEKWVKNPDILKRFFNADEMAKDGEHCVLTEHYAARFAAKEAFSKAMDEHYTEVSLSKDFPGIEGAVDFDRSGEGVLAPSEKPSYISRQNAYLSLILRSISRAASRFAMSSRLS